jgi:hypothetical protein
LQFFSYDHKATVVPLSSPSLAVQTTTETSLLDEKYWQVKIGSICAKLMNRLVFNGSKWMLEVSLPNKKRYILLVI